MSRTDSNSLLVSIVQVADGNPGKRFTAKQVGSSALTLRGLAEDGLVVDTGDTVKNTDADGKALRGRPAHLFKVTRKGRDQVRRAAAKSVEA